MVEVVINTCYGGFGISTAAEEAITKRKGKELEYMYIHHEESFRADTDLVAVVKELGEKANGSCAKLRIVEVDDDALWAIEEYDGMEHVRETSRAWY
jgi:hypothetical protein|tara:strand:- start:3977 stop:4267 length:291 start_codon:yes stop_codon:yes gene_type:complete